MKALALLAGLLMAGPAGAGCRLALLLALDISTSVDMREDRLQREGLAQALRDREVQAAILALPSAPVALAVYEWSGRYQQATTLPWTVLDGPDTLARATGVIAASERAFDRYPTALGYAVGHAATLFAGAPDCAARTLDVSGDGITNDGFGPRLAYGNFPLDDVTVNALAIGGAGDDAALLSYYRDELIRGPGAFLITADGYRDFARAMRRKLLREIGSAVVGGSVLAPARQGG